LHCLAVKLLPPCPRSKHFVRARTVIETKSRRSVGGMSARRAMSSGFHVEYSHDPAKAQGQNSKFCFRMKRKRLAQPSQRMLATGGRQTDTRKWSRISCIRTSQSACAFNRLVTVNILCQRCGSSSSNRTDQSTDVGDGFAQQRLNRSGAMPTCARSVI
jgi:hypothetical protein